VSAGQNHSLFLTDTGEVYACGSNAKDQLGITEVDSVTFKPIKIQSLAKYQVKKIDASHHSAAVTINGELFLWGTGVFGQYKTP
jgi:X-linked retinitis pigmentosa GTPase regulator